MQNQSTKFKKAPLLLSIIFFLTSCAAFFFLYRLIEHNNTIADQAETAWREEANKRSDLQSLDRSLKATGVEKTQLDTHFIKSVDIVPFLNMLEKTAERVGAKAEVSNVDAPKDNSGLIVEVRVDGRFEAIYKFLTLLENSPYELDILTMDIRKMTEVDSKEKASTPAWAAVFKVKLLSFVQ